MKSKFRLPLVLLATSSALLSAGCVTTHEIPEAQFATTRAAIEEAQEAGARDVAPVELRTAEQHFETAKRLAEDGEYVAAQQAALKSEADAKLAEARAETAEAQNSVRELQDSLRVLRQELERQSGK